MELKTWVRKKLREGTFSKEPHPIAVFILFGITLLLAIYFYNLEIDIFFKNFAILLSIFTLIFAFAHWYVWGVAKNKK